MPLLQGTGKQLQTFAEKQQLPLYIRLQQQDSLFI